MTAEPTAEPVRARALSEILRTADASASAGAGYAPTPWATGLSPLDRELNGGLRPGELVILGGAQGVGKTTIALQIARNVVAAGGVATYLCYEHDERVLLQRLIAMEASFAEPEAAVGLAAVGNALAGTAPVGLQTRVAHLPGAVAALGALVSYGDRLRLVTGGASTGAAEVRQLAEITEDSGLLVVDYLQKLAPPAPGLSEGDRTTLAVEALKNAAMEFAVPILAISAADREGLAEGRTRLAHMRGSTAIAYEADIALMLDDKWHAVARHHLMYAGAAVQQYRDWVVCTVEKNRAGRPGTSLEFRKRFDHSHIDPQGQQVQEELIDDRVFRE